MSLIQTKEEAMKRFSKMNCRVNVPSDFSVSPSQYAYFYTLGRCDDIYSFIHRNSDKIRRNTWEELKSSILKRFSYSGTYDTVESVQFQGHMLRMEVELAYPFLEFQEQLRDVICDENYDEMIKVSSFGYRWFYEVEKELMNISKTTVSKINQGERPNVYAPGFADVWNSVSTFQSFAMDYMLEKEKVREKKL